jgi:hypothetical protein
MDPDLDLDRQQNRKSDPDHDRNNSSSICNTGKEKIHTQGTVRVLSSSSPVPVPKYTHTVLISQLVFPIWIRMASVLIRIHMGVKMCAKNVYNCSKPNNFNRSWTFL